MLLGVALIIYSLLEATFLETFFLVWYVLKFFKSTYLYKAEQETRETSCFLGLSKEGMLLNTILKCLVVSRGLLNRFM